MSLRIVTLGLLVIVGCRTTPPQRVLGEVSEECLTTEDCPRGKVCRESVCVVACDKDDDCDSNQLCDSGTCTLRVPPSLSFPNGARARLYVGEPALHYAPVVVPGPHSGGEELRWTVLVAPEGAPAISGASVGDAPQEAIDVVPTVPGLYVLQATLTNRGGSATATAIIDVVEDACFAYLKHDTAQGDGLYRLRTTGLVELVDAVASENEPPLITGMARLNDREVAYYDRYTDTKVLEEQAPTDGTSSCSSGERYSSDHCCPNAMPRWDWSISRCCPASGGCFSGAQGSSGTSGTTGITGVTGVSGTAPGCSAGNTRYGAICCTDPTVDFSGSGQCCPPTHEFFDGPATASPPDTGDRCRLLERHDVTVIKRAGGKQPTRLLELVDLPAGAGGTCAWGDADAAGSTTCEYKIRWLSASADGQRLAAIVNRGDDATAVLVFDASSTTITRTPSGLPDPKYVFLDGIEIAGTDYAYLTVALSPDGKTLAAFLINNNMGPSLVRLYDVATRMLITELDASFTSINSPSVPLSLAVSDDRRVLVGTTPGAMGISRPNGVLPWEYPFLVASAPDRVAFSAAESLAMAKCTDCASGYPNPFPAWDSAGCDSDLCCACLKSAGRVDPRFSCEQTIAMQLVPENRGTFAAAVPVGAPVFATLAARSPVTDCTKVFGELALTSPEYEILMHDAQASTTRSLPLAVSSSLPAPRAPFGISYVAEGRQLVFVANNDGAPPRGHMWRINVDGSGLVELSPNDVAQVIVATPRVCAETDATLIAALVVLLYACARSMLRRRRA